MNHDGFSKRYSMKWRGVGKPKINDKTLYRRYRDFNNLSALYEALAFVMGLMQMMGTFLEIETGKNRR